MPLIFTAAIPNSPELAQECFSSVETHSATCRALQELEGELYFMKPDLVVLLTSHGNPMPELISTNISHEVHGEWPQQSSVEKLSRSFTGDVEFAAHIKEVVDTTNNSVPMTITADVVVPLEVATPLFFLLNHLPQTKVVVISTAQFSFEEHKAFGHFIRHEAIKTNKRVAIIASGRMGDGNPASSPFSFSELCMRYVRENEQQKIIGIDQEVYRRSHADIGEPLAVLLGVIDTLNVRSEILSYEEIHGSGQLVLNFILQ